MAGRAAAARLRSGLLWAAPAGEAVQADPEAAPEVVAGAPVENLPLIIAVIESKCLYSISQGCSAYMLRHSVSQHSI